MIAKNKKRIIITIPEYELSKLQRAIKCNIHYKGMSKTQVINELIRTKL